MQNFDETLGIKIKASKVGAKVLMYLKNRTGKSLGETRKCVEEGNYVFCCDLYDDDGLRKINLMKMN